MDMKNSSKSSTSSRNDTVIGGSTLVRNLQAAVHPVAADSRSNNNRNNIANVHVHIIPSDTTASGCIDASDSYRSRKDTNSVPCVKRTTVQLCLPMKKRIKNSSSKSNNSATDSCIQGTTDPMVNHGYKNKANNDVVNTSIADVTPSYAAVNHWRLTSSSKRTVNSSPSVAGNKNSQILFEKDDIDDIPIDDDDDIPIEDGDVDDDDDIPIEDGDVDDDDEILSMVETMDDTRRLGNEIGAKYIMTQATALKERIASYLRIRKQHAAQQKQQQQKSQEPENGQKGSIDECQHHEQQTSADGTTTTVSDFCVDLLEVERQSILTQATKIREVSIQFRTINSMYKKLMDEFLLTEK